MKKILISLIVMSLMTAMPAAAGKGGGPKFSDQKPSERAYQRANENAAFKREEGWKKGADQDDELSDITSRKARKQEREQYKEEKKLEKRKRKEDRKRQKENTYRGERRERERANEQETDSEK